MGYSIPTFNLTASHWRCAHPYDFDAKTHVGDFLCNLRGFGQQHKDDYATVGNAPYYPLGYSVLCPALTDVRDANNDALTLDFLEVPAGSERWYVVLHVDDIGKGFPNEYRAALVAKPWVDAGVANAPKWPVPIP